MLQAFKSCVINHANSFLEYWNIHVINT